MLRNTDGNTVLHHVCVYALRNTDGNMGLHDVCTCVCALRNTDGHKGTSTETWTRQGKVFATVTRSYMMCVCVLRNTDGNMVLHDVCMCDKEHWL